MNFKDYVSGDYLPGFKYKYFLPSKINHSFTWDDEEINGLLEAAAFKLGELNAFSRYAPDTDLFIKMHIVKEAVESNKIEGTKTNIEEAISDEINIDPEKKDDWQEVNNYVIAMNTAIENLNELPLSTRLINNTHRILLSSVRGKHKNPGEIRKSQNWIGGASLDDATYIPPAHHELPELLNDLENFIHNENLHIPHLVKIAIAHYQFESIHPYLDGNGRIGRLIITLYLVNYRILEKPLLYLSDYFDRHRPEYYDKLNRTRTENALSEWVKFFLKGVYETANNAVSTLKKIETLKAEIEKNKIINFGKRIGPAYELLNGLFKSPSVSIKNVQGITGLSPKAANDLVQLFVDNNILSEATGFQRNRQFIFREYINLF